MMDAKTKAIVTAAEELLRALHEEVPAVDRKFTELSRIDEAMVKLNDAIEAYKAPA